MKLLSFTHEGRARIGLLEGDEVVDVTAGRSGLPSDMLGLIHAGPEALSQLLSMARAAPRIALSAVTLHAPIARPGKILALGRNYADHVAELGNDIPAHQMWFAKMPSSVNGPYDPIPLPRVSTFVDYEVELVAIVGQRAKHVAQEDALSILFGYCVGNDVTARDWQRRTSQFVLGKSFDGHAPFGPWITTADEIADPQALDIRCLVNGRVHQSANTKLMLFSVAAQIAELTQVMTLEPGDLIFTGTPSGVGAGMDPPFKLSPGDIVRCEIERLGFIEGICEADA